MTQKEAQNGAILIAEDEKEFALILKEQLKQCGFSVNTVNKGSQVLEALKKYNPRLLILDLIMPGMTGFEVLHQLRKSQKFSELKVIVLSNQNQPSEIAKVKQMGVIEHITKTDIRLHDMVEKIKSIMHVS